MSVLMQTGGEARLTRLAFLANIFPESAEALGFIGRILEYQSALSESLKGAGDKAIGPQAIPWEDHLQSFSALLALCVECGTEEIKNRAEELKVLTAEELGLSVRNFIKGRTTDDVTRFLLLAFMQPIASVLLALPETNDDHPNNRCPVCGFPPSVSFLKDAPEAEGGRYLRCLLCRHNWPYSRTTCVSCGNNRDDSIDYFYDQAHKHISIQSCGECAFYIKIVDTRLDGMAIPDLEDIASLSLDIWASGKGLVKVSGNLIGA